MAVTFRSATSDQSAASTTIIVDKPAGTVDGDLIIVSIALENTSITAAPSGWTQVTGSPLTNGTLTSAVYWKIASSEPATWTWTNSSSAPWATTAASYSGVDNTTPVHKQATATGGNVTSLASATVTTTIDNCEILTLPSVGPTNASTAGSTMSAAASTTKRAEGVSTLSGFNVTQDHHDDNALLHPAGVSTSRTPTASAAANQFSIFTVALAPAAAVASANRALLGVGA